ncbi:MAG: CDP-diacylglycerol diphosphatase [Acetobacteraceae bacterium]|nr:CDP-diacylglycerol diphosphatase [Acetobacteraceae bacterium]
MGSKYPVATRPPHPLIYRVLVAALPALAVHCEALAENADALWEIVHGQCVPDQVKNNDPAPCAYVDLRKGQAEGYAILKDRRGATQFLLIPTARVAGIESAALLAPDSPNYWNDAWQARTFVLERLGHPLPRDEVGMAVNSKLSRSQNQLHIHIDCVRLDVIEALHRQQAAISMSWRTLAEPLAGHRYEAMRVAGADLNGNNPFRLLAQEGGIAAAQMGLETLVVIGARFPDGSPGFYLLSALADPLHGYLANGEELLDHACRVGAHNDGA